MILITNDNLRDATTAADLFHYMGVLAYPTVYKDALPEASSKYRTYLLYDPDDSPMAARLVQRIKEASEGACVIEIRSGGNFASCRESKYGADAVIAGDLTGAALAREIALVRYGSADVPLSEYRIPGLLTDSADTSVSYLGERIRLTKTELMIVKFLCVTYPAPTDAKSILKYAFRQAAAPELANIRTHISVINRKAISEAGARLISSEPRVGYALIGSEAQSVSNRLQEAYLT